MELPSNIKGMLSLEDVSVSFDESRFILDSEDSKVVKRVLDIWKTTDKLNEYGIRYLNTLLLFGQSGCGKTMLGRYIAFKSGIPFAYVNFSHLISSYLGTTGKNIKDVFDFVAKTKCVFMVDEIDAVGVARGGSNEVGEVSRIVINLMQALDTLETGTIVIGATNRLDIIDEALLRRFSIQHEVKLPNVELRGEIFRSYMNSISEATYDESDVQNFVQMTEGYSCAKIVNLIVNNLVECLIGGSNISGSAIAKLA